MPGLRGADPSAAAGVPVLPQPQHGRARRLRQGHAVRIHRQPPVRLSRPAAAVCGRPGRRGGGSASSVDHQHRRLRARRARVGPDGRGRLPEDRGCLAPGVPAHGQQGDGPASRGRDRTRRLRPLRELTADHREVRGALRDHRHRRIPARPPPDGAAAVAHHRRVRSRDRRRRFDAGRHRRTVDLPRTGHRGHG